MLVAVALFSVGIVAVSPLLGMASIPWRVVVDPTASGMEADILWRFRVPRVCASFLAGSGLAVAGVAFQAMFRNPLATPFTLGVSSGASLGASIYVHLGLGFAVLGLSGISIFAFVGALLAISMVYGLSRARGGFSTATLLLAGVAISFFFTSLLLFTQYLSDLTHSFRIVHWLMGGLEIVGFEPVLNLLPFVVAGCLILAYLTRELNLLATGEELATSRGLNVRWTKNALFFATSLMVGGVVALCGPIGFVGMMVPHICRLLVGPNHSFLLPASLLFGGAFLTLCDTLARTVIAPAEIPVGVITALLGGPFFLWLLLTRSLAGDGLGEER